MKGLPTSERQIKYLTDIQTSLGYQINIPKKSKECGKKIKSLLSKFKNQQYEKQNSYTRK